MKFAFRRFLFLTLALLGLFSTLPVAAVSLPHRVVRVGFPEAAGLSETDANGRRGGMVVDYLMEISKYTNWEYEFVTGDDALFDQLASGEIDLMGGMFRDPTLEQMYSYPDYNMGTNRAVLFARKKDDRILSYDLRTLDGMTIGVFNMATEKIRRLKYYLEFNDLDCPIKYYTNADMTDNSLYAHLQNGAVDLLLGNDTERPKDVKRATEFVAQPIYFATAKGNTEILAGLNTALSQIYESNPGYAELRYEANFRAPSANELQLTQEEQNYISTRGPVQVVTVSGWHPLFCMNTETLHNGIVPDILDEIAARTGLQFSYIHAATYAESLQLVRNGQADLLGCFLGSDREALLAGLAQTASYTNLGNIIVKSKTSSYPGPGLTGGVLTSRFLPPGFQAEQIEYFPNALRGIQAVEDGQVDFFYGLSSTLEAELQRYHYPNVSILTLDNDRTDINLALPRPADTMLLTILNKGIGNLTTLDKESITRHNTLSSGYISSISLLEIIYANPVAVIFLVSAFLLLIIVVVLVVARAKVNNTIMQGQLHRIAAASQAKSDFLSKMSHEIRTPMNAIVGLSDLICMTQNLPTEVVDRLKKLRASSRYLLALINDILDMSRIENDKMILDSEAFSMGRMLNELESMIQSQADQKSLRCIFRSRVSQDWFIGDALRLKQVLTNLLSNALKFTPKNGEIQLVLEERAVAEGHARLRFSVRDSGIGIAPEFQDQVFGAFEQAGTPISKSAGTGLGLPISRSIVQLMGGDLNLRSKPGEGSEFYFSISLPFCDMPNTPPVPDHLPKCGFDGICVLLAEDNDLNAEIAADLLSMRGITTERAANGQEAVDFFVASPPGHFHIILMDIQMPVKNGLDAARIIRACAHADAKTIPIVAMTANSFKEDVAAATEAGMNGFVPKPVDVTLLYQMLEEKVLKNR